ncbi:MAG TPA: hypothetical protein VMW48_06635, partial [Vicinamibacterales bacterium]|nr:hypothetical protein [Vicinamibacterales bacterium]
MKIAIINDDTRWGPGDPAEARLGAASLAPEYLARALAARGHEVCRISNGRADIDGVPGTDRAAVAYRYRKTARRHGGFDAVIASRNRYLTLEVEARARFVWTGDAHNEERWEAYHDLTTVAKSPWLAERLRPRIPDVLWIPGGVPDALFSRTIDCPRVFRFYTSGVFDPCRG